jgi:ATP synthase protein I
MNDPERPPSLNDLETRLKAVREREAGQRRARPQLGIEMSGRYGAAWRVAVELVAGLVVGGGMGWLLDSVLGTRPWLFLVFFFLGAGAGIRGVYRAAREISAPEGAPPEAHREEKAPPGPRRNGG